MGAASPGERSLEEAWREALALSETGKIHEAVFEFESVALDLERQLAAAQTTTGGARLAALLGKLLGKLEAEIDAHLAYLRGNLFAALELDLSAGTAEVKKAYRRLALRYHPDKSGVSPKLFTIVQQAYETLGEPGRRRTYRPDKSAEEWASWRRACAADARSALDLCRPKPSHLTAKDVRSMSVGELKAELRRRDVPEKGLLERVDLEAALLTAIGAAPTLDVRSLALELRSAAAADRNQRIAGLSTDCLRRLLEARGQSPAVYVSKPALATAVVEAFADVPVMTKSKFVEGLRSRTSAASDEARVAPGGWFWGRAEEAAA